MTSPDKIIDAVLAALMTQAGQIGWRHVRLEEVAQEAGITLGDLRAIARDKTDLLRLFIERTDAEVLREDSGFGPDDSVRDRLFDLLMRRFDALDDHKAGVESAFHDVMRDPVGLFTMAPVGMGALRWYLEAAGVATDGPLGLVRVQGLSAVWLSALRVWFADDSEDLAPTMKILDRDLGRAEQAAGWLAGRGDAPWRKSPDEATETPEPEAPEPETPEAEAPRKSDAG
jgi:AcrR family transcriptional regulator